MKVINILATLFLALTLSFGITTKTFGVTLTVGNAEADLRSDNSVSIDISVDDSSEITGAAFTLIYDTDELQLTSVQSDFFATFAEQFTTWAPQDILSQLLLMLNEAPYSQPLLTGLQDTSGTKIVATRVQNGELSTQTLFTLTFDISNATDGNHSLGISQSIISNTQAGYSNNGETIPLLTGAVLPSQNQDLTDPATFPEIAVTSTNNGTITITGSTEVIIANKPSQTVTIEAGESSDAFTVAGGDDRLYSWIVQNSADQLIDSQTGSAYTFTAPSTGAFAGAYTVTVTDYQGFTDSFTINVPLVVSPETLSFTEVKLDSTANPQTFTVTGAEDNADFTWEILASQGATDEVASPGDYGTWEDASPVYSQNTNVLSPADVTSWKSFYLRVTVDNDTDLTQANGLYRKVIGPFTLVPVGIYNIYLSDNLGALDNTTLSAGDITVSETSTNQTKNNISPNGTVSFLLPESGGTFHYEVNDNRNPSIYVNKSLSSAATSVYITLENEGLDYIDGLVEDVTNAPVSGATVIAYHPANIAVKYTTTTDTGGIYALNLPVGAALSGWSVVVSHPDYIAQRRDDQTVGIVDFTGAKALYSETKITNVTATRVNSTVRIDITTNPAIADASEVDVTVASGNGNLSALSLTDNIDSNATVSFTYDAYSDFALTIKVDTSEDYNPNIGYWTEQEFNFTAVNNLQASTQITMSSTGGSITLTADDKIASVNVPPGGINNDDITIVVEQFLKNDGLSHVYEITAIDNQTSSEIANTAINYLEITLPIDLNQINPGDLENSVWFIRHADNLVALEAGRNVSENNSTIISTDYIGDGQTGSVTFHVNSLSVFEISLSGGSSIVGSASSEEGAAGCFIAASSNSSVLDLYARIFTRLHNAFKRIVE